MITISLSFNPANVALSLSSLSLEKLIDSAFRVTLHLAFNDLAIDLDCIVLILFCHTLLPYPHCSLESPIAYASFTVL